MFGDPAGGVFGFTTIGDSAMGDVPHGSVVARAYMYFGALSEGSGYLHVDYAAWAGDLITAWADYERQRLAGNASDAYTYMLRVRLCGRGS